MVVLTTIRLVVSQTGWRSVNPGFYHYESFDCGCSKTAADTAYKLINLLNQLNGQYTHTLFEVEKLQLYEFSHTFQEGSYIDSCSTN